MRKIGITYPEEEAKLEKVHLSEIPGSQTPSPHCSTDPKLLPKVGTSSNFLHRSSDPWDDSEIQGECCILVSAKLPKAWALAFSSGAICYYNYCPRFIHHLFPPGMLSYGPPSNCKYFQSNKSRRAYRMIHLWHLSQRKD